MSPLFNIILVLILSYLVFKWLTKNNISQEFEENSTYIPNRTTPDFKCAYCRYCKKLENEGVLCKYGKAVIFKTPVHINNCIDFERNS